MAGNPKRPRPGPGTSPAPAPSVEDPHPPRAEGPPESPGKGKPCPGMGWSAAVSRPSGQLHLRPAPATLKSFADVNATGSSAWKPVASIINQTQVPPGSRLCSSLEGPRVKPDLPTQTSIMEVLAAHQRHSAQYLSIMEVLWQLWVITSRTAVNPESLIFFTSTAKEGQRASPAEFSGGRVQPQGSEARRSGRVSRRAFPATTSSSSL